MIPVTLKAPHIGGVCNDVESIDNTRTQPYWSALYAN